MPIESGAHCPSCAADVLPDDEFCPTCEAPIRAPERRVVTLCFADLSGYTALVEDLDPEVAHQAVQPLMRRLRRVCESFGALVPGVQGDGFMAVFGLPIGHEDDARRALEAAALMQRTVSEWQIGPTLDGPPLTLHVGVHTGAVLAAPSREAGGWSVTGDAVNVTSRLCGQAQASTILVSSETRRLSGIATGFGENVSHPVRGRREPVNASLWSWRDAKVPNRRPIRWDAPLINRESQLRELSSFWARREAAVLIGEPGVGKTRLVLEWARQEDALLIGVGTRAFGAAAWWEPLHEAVRSLAPAGGINKLLAGADPVAATPLTRRRWHDLLGPVGTDARAAAEGFADLVRALAVDKRVVVLLDDAQDAAPELVTLMAELVGSVAVIATARPGTDLPAPFVRVDLEPLSVDHSEQLITSLLGRPEPEEIRSITASAGGNPFFVEECVHFLATRPDRTVNRLDGLGTGAVGMRTFVAARVDALNAPARQTLAALAIIRESAPMALLRLLEPAATDDVLAGLERSGMLRPVTDGAVAPQFRHGVTREVVAAGLSFAVGQQMHVSAADFYARRVILDSDRLLALAGRSSHATAAYALAAALSLDEATQLPYRAAAAEAAVAWAEQLHLADPAAVDYVTDEARTLARDAGASAAELMLRLDLIDLAGAYDRGADDTTVADLEEVVAEAAALGPRWELRARFLHAQSVFDAGQRELGLRLLRDLASAAEAETEPDLRHQVLMALGDMSGTAQAALEVFQRAVASAHDRESRIAALNRSATMANYFDIREARRHLTGVFGLLGEADVTARAWADLVGGWTWLYDQRFDQAARAADLVLVSGVVGHVWMLEGHAVFVASEAQLRLGKLSQSRSLLATVEARVRQRSHSKGTITLQRLLALLSLREGDLDASAQALTAVSAVPADDAFEVGSAAAVLGECLTERGEFAQGSLELRAAFVAAEAAGNAVKAVSIGLNLLRAMAARNGVIPSVLLATLTEVAQRAGADHTAGLLTAWAAHGAGLPHSGFKPQPELPQELAVAAEFAALGNPASADRALRRALGLWVDLGHSVWRARCGFWLAELTGDETHAATARGMLETLQSPAGLEEKFRRQWRTAQGRT